MKRINPEPVWLYGDYLSGRSPESIAELWALPIEIVEGHLSMEARRRKKLQAKAKTYVAPTKKPKVPAKKPRRKTTAWLSIGQLAWKLGMTRYALVAIVGTPEAEAMGLESKRRSSDSGGGMRYRINYEKVKK